MSTTNNCNVCNSTLENIHNDLGWCDKCKYNRSIYSVAPALPFTGLETEFREYKEKTEKRLAKNESDVRDLTDSTEKRIVKLEAKKA